MFIYKGNLVSYFIKSLNVLFKIISSYTFLHITRKDAVNIKIYILFPNIN